jgi:hypothetical protein
MKILEDFSLASESESDDNDSAADRESTTLTTATATRTSITSSERPCIPRRCLSIASLHETEVSGSQNRIKMELESEEEYAELGPSNNITMPKVEPLEEGHFVDSLADREMCRVYYDSLTEVKPPLGIIPFTEEEEGEMPHLRFTWRMFLLVGTLRLVICLKNKSLHYLIHEKNVRCVLWGRCAPFAIFQIILYSWKGGRKLIFWGKYTVHRHRSTGRMISLVLIC